MIFIFSDEEDPVHLSLFVLSLPPKTDQVLVFSEEEERNEEEKDEEEEKDDEARRIRE